MRAKQREIFANIPEFYVKDMCSWFSFVSVHNPGALKGLDVSVDYMLFSFLLNKETFLEDKISHRLKKLDPPFIFFSVRERVVSSESCNLIGSGRGQNFPISDHGHGIRAKTIE